MKIDYRLLQEQRNVLLDLVYTVEEGQKIVLDGVINLLDALLDEGEVEGKCRFDDEGCVHNLCSEGGEENDPNIVLRT